MKLNTLIYITLSLVVLTTSLRISQPNNANRGVCIFKLILAYCERSSTRIYCAEYS